MCILPDFMILDLAFKGMITPFIDHQEAFCGTNRGLAQCSYDVTLGTTFSEQKSSWSRYTAPLVDPSCTVEYDIQQVSTHPKVGYYELAPGAFVLAHTVEVVNIPNNIVAEIKDKSSWARLGLQVKNTMANPGFKGQITLELSNEGNYNLKLIPGVGICQLVFNTLAYPCGSPYNGRYQHQTGAQGPIPMSSQ